MDLDRKGPGRSKKSDPDPPKAPGSPAASAGPIKATEAQKNLHATFRLAARALRSDAKFTEDSFEDAAQGLVDAAKQFPQAEPVIRGIVRALGPAVMAADLAEKFSRLFGASGVKKDLEQKRAQWRPPWRRDQAPAQEEPPGPDHAPDV